MKVRQPALLQKLRIWQQNVHKSKTAQAYVLNTANPKDWDFLALQEPWFDYFGNSCSTQYWRVIYPANFYTEGHVRVRSILLINTNLSTDCYSILPVMHSDISAVRFKGDNGYLSLFNIYNEITNNGTLTYLDSFLMQNAHVIRPSVLDCIIWIGDFNRHYPMWEEDSNKKLFEPANYIAPLIDLLYRNKMLLALPKGIPNYQPATCTWMRPDNVWQCNTPDDPIHRCDVIPVIRPPLADHLPVMTIVDMPLPRIPKAYALNFRQANWIRVNEDLAQCLEADLPAARIASGEEFKLKVNKLVHIIKEVLGDHLKERRPSPYMDRWWTKELTQLKKQQNKLSGKAYKLRHVRDHPIHVEYQTATQNFKDIMKETRSQDWTDWLKAASQQDLYITNKYILNDPSDYSNMCMLSLRTTTNGSPSSADDNVNKARALAELLFPPPP